MIAEILYLRQVLHIEIKKEIAHAKMGDLYEKARHEFPKESQSQPRLKWLFGCPQKLPVFVVPWRYS